MHMPLSGSAQYIIDGKNIAVDQNSFLLFSPETAHRLIFASEDFSEFVFGFDLISPKGLFLNLSKKPFFKGTDTVYLHSAVDHMLKNAQNYLLGFNLAILNQLTCLCIELFQQVTGEVSATEDIATNDMRIDLAVKFIDDNISSEITCLDVADCVHVSLRHLNRLCEKSLSTSIAGLILLRKIRYAKKLMADPERSLLSISDLTGFSSQQQFSKAFKRIEGITPTQYKKDLNK